MNISVVSEYLKTFSTQIIALALNDGMKRKPEIHWRGEQW